MQLHILVNQQQQGPLDEREVRGRLAAGELSPGDLGWHDGMREWKPLEEIPCVRWYRHEEASSAPVTYYKIDSRRIGFLEYARLADGNWLGLLAAWTCKLFQIPLKLAEGVPSPLPIELMVVPEEHLSNRALRYFDSLSGPLSDLGFRMLHYAMLKRSLLPMNSCLADFLHPDGKACIRVIHVEAFQGRTPTENRMIFVLSRLDERRFLTTGNFFGGMKTHPDFVVERVFWQEPERLLAHHFKRLQQMAASGPLALPEGQAFADMLDMIERINHEYQIRRGVYIPMTEPEVVQARRRRHQLGVGE